MNTIKSTSDTIDSDKLEYPHDVFLFHMETYGYSLEAPRHGASNEYHNRRFGV